MCQNINCNEKKNFFFCSCPHVVNLKCIKQLIYEMQLNIVCEFVFFCKKTYDNNHAKIAVFIWVRLKCQGSNYKNSKNTKFFKSKSIFSEYLQQIKNN